MTIYTLMNRIFTLRFAMTMAVNRYNENDHLYWIYEEEAKASFNTLCNCGFLDEYDADELREQLYHVMRVYKRRSRKG